MTVRPDEITMGNPNFVHGFSYRVFITMLLLYWLIDKRILYNIPIGEKCFYSKMIMNTYEHSLTLNKPGSLHYYLGISIIKYLCQQYINYLILKIIFILQDIKNQVFLCYYYCVYVNAQFNLCAKRLHGHQTCYHLELIS